MIATVWRYRVKPEHRAEFERAYGPDGDWARLFRRHEGYLGTELLRRADGPAPLVPSDVEGPALDYLTVDRWRSKADFAAFLTDHRADYDALDAATEGWTVEEVRLGVWTRETSTSLPTG